jgi:hypothetical protein
MGVAARGLDRKDIKDVQKGKGPGGEFKTRWEAAQGSKSAADYASLLSWCKDKSMALQATLVATTLVRLDPSRVDARAAAGLDADPVAKAEEADRQGGFILYLGRNWVPRELKAKLLKDGHRLVNGLWYARKEKERLITMPGIFKYKDATTKPVLVSGSGCDVMAEKKRTYATAQRSMPKQEYTEETLRWYWTVPLVVTESQGGGVPPGYANSNAIDYIGRRDTALPRNGQQVSGEVYITVPLNETVLEAWVTTKAEVKQGGSITVSLLHQGRKEKLYTCASVEDQARKLPDLVVGKTQIDLVADIAFVATYKLSKEVRPIKKGLKDGNNVIEKDVTIVHDRMIPDPSALLFPSTQSTNEVFRLRAVVGEPAPALDKLFENSRGVLAD